MRKINKNGLALIKRWEGLRLSAYQDSAGVWTIGYGHTAAVGKPYVYEGMKISGQKAEAILMRDLEQYETAINDVVKVPLTDNQFAALVSFAYNVGVGALRKSTLLKKLNKGDYDSVPAELMKWVNAGGKKLKGLENRRAAEAGLWVTGEFVASRDVKPQPVGDNPVTKPETLAPIIGALSGLGSVFSGTGPMQWALAIVMVVSCLVGAWWFIRRMREQEAVSGEAMNREVKQEAVRAEPEQGTQGKQEAVSGEATNREVKKDAVSGEAMNREGKKEQST